MWRGSRRGDYAQSLSRLVMFGFCVLGVGETFFKDRDPADNHDQAAADQSAKEHDRNKASGKYRQREAHLQPEPFSCTGNRSYSRISRSVQSIEKPGEPDQSYQGIVVFLASAFYSADTDSYITRHARVSFPSRLSCKPGRNRIHHET